MLMPWNAAANLWHRARKPAPVKRKTHAPIGDAKLNVFTNTQPPPGERRYSLVPDAQRRDELGEWMACQDCGLHICGCEQRFEMQQEAQRAQLARDVDARHSMRPGVQQHLRHGDPRRMSLGYNERDYDESRRANIAIMKAERDALLGDPERGLFEINVGDRLHTLAHAIHEHERKLPVMPKMTDAMLQYPDRAVLMTNIGSTDVTTDPDSFFVELEAEAGKQITTTVDQWNKLLGARSGELKWFRST